MKKKSTFLQKKRLSREGKSDAGLYNYKFGNKELQEELGLNMYDYGARNYDAAIGRTTTYDPLAEKFYSISPQSFLNNNPLYFIDPTGMKADGWITQMVDGNASHTYEKDINTVEEAKAAGYENVSQVSQSMTISNSSYNYSYSLNSDGSVTNTSSGTNAQFQTAIKDGMFVVGGSMTTAGGSTINTTNLGSNPLDALPKASGRIEAMEFSSPFFPAGMIFKSLGRAVTTADGFLFGSITAKTPFNIPVQRFGQMSYGRSDFWGLQLGTSKFVNRTFVAIKPEWNSLTQFTSGVIPKGTSMQFGIVGPQGLAYPGGSLQFLVNSKSVINQSSKVIPR